MNRPKNKDVEEKKLIAEIIAGDDEKIGELIAGYEKYLMLLFFRRGFDHQTCEDLLQETTIKVYKAIKSFDFKAKFSTWLSRIAMNLAIDMYRKNGGKRQKNTQYFSTIGAKHKGSVDDWLSANAFKNRYREVGDELASNEDKKMVEDAVFSIANRFKARKRKIFYAMLMGYDCKEISQLLDINHNTVRWNRFSIINTIREGLPEDIKAQFLEN